MKYDEQEKLIKMPEFQSLNRNLAERQEQPEGETTALWRSECFGSCCQEQILEWLT